MYFYSFIRSGAPNVAGNWPDSVEKLTETPILKITKADYNAWRFSSTPGL
jgi:hypothetical protein